MFRVFALSLITVTATTLGASAQSLVGKWDCDGRQDRSIAIRTLMDYRASGAFYHLANVAAGDRNGRIDAAVALRGTWNVKGNMLLEKINTARLRTISANGQDISRTPLGRQMAKSLPAQLKGPTGVSRTRIKFVNANTFRLTSGKVKATCTKR